MFHHEFSESQRTWKTYDFETHELVFSCEARNETIANGQYGHYGNCPPGQYKLGGLSHMNTQPFGPYFIEVVDVNGLWKQYGRAGIGLHGGGSCVVNWSAGRQGWCPTEGCIRFQNADLVTLVQKFYHPGDTLDVAA